MSTFKLSSMSNWKLSRVLKVMDKWSLIWVNASRFKELKGQLSVTDRFTVHEDQIIEIECSKNPTRARICCHIKRFISGQLE